MYYFRYPYIIYRDYPDFGYLTDNRHFGYDTASKSCLKLGDRILSKIGSVFYSVLTDAPRPLSEIVADLSAIFPEASLIDIESDAKEFLGELSQDGFVGYSCDNNISHKAVFSYELKTPYNLPCLETPANIDNSWNDELKLLQVHLNISGLCNEHCIHCYLPDAYRKTVMTKDQFLTILEQCKACKVLNITLSGGEPLLNPNLPFFIDECRKNNFSINILSNLTLLAEDLASLFKETPMLSVQTSLYSMDSAVHDSITKVKGSFSKTKQAIEMLRGYNIPLQINCPIMKQNVDTYQDVLSWANSLNIEANSDYMIFGCFDGSAHNLDCRLELPAVKTIIENEEFRRSRTTVSLDYDVSRELEHTVCPVCVDSLCISYNGDVYPCEGWQSLVIGNVNDTPLHQIWTASRDIDMLRHLTIEKDFPQCVNCENKEYCSICLVRNANESNTGNFKDVNQYFCEIAKIKRIIANRK